MSVLFVKERSRCAHQGAMAAGGSCHDYLRFSRRRPADLGWPVVVVMLRLEQLDGGCTTVVATIASNGGYGHCPLFFFFSPAVLFTGQTAESLLLLWFGLEGLCFYVSFGL
ncbi:unnamed protein product [Prunus armeniaca]